jgi:hypothetical protein
MLEEFGIGLNKGMCKRKHRRKIYRRNIHRIAIHSRNIHRKNINRRNIHSFNRNIHIPINPTHLRITTAVI